MRILVQLCLIAAAGAAASITTVCHARDSGLPLLRNQCPEPFTENLKKMHIPYRIENSNDGGLIYRVINISYRDAVKSELISDDFETMDARTGAITTWPKDKNYDVTWMLGPEQKSSNSAPDAASVSCTRTMTFPQLSTHEADTPSTAQPQH